MVKKSSADEGDTDSIPGSGRSPGEGNGNPVFLPGKFHGEKSLVGYIVHGVVQSQTLLKCCLQQQQILEGIVVLGLCIKKS